MTAQAKIGRGRSRAFDLLRLLFAISVLLTHAPELVDGTNSREILTRLTHQTTLGVLAVDGFFLISGFLIVQSWQRNPNLLTFSQHRLRRIVPGYVVAALLSILVVGLLAPGADHFFRGLGMSTVRTILFLDQPVTPPVFPGLPLRMLNASLWTISYEMRCYILVPIFGLLGLLRRPWMFAVAMLFPAVLWLVPAVRNRLRWHSFQLVFGHTEEIARLVTIFMVGSCFFLFRERIRYTRTFAALSAVALVAGLCAPGFGESAFVLFGGYLIFYFGRMPIHTPAWLQRVPDISYGIYLYGWPVESLWAWYERGSPWVLFAGSLAICIVLGCLSWFLVEKPLMAKSKVPLAGDPQPANAIA